MSFWWLFLFCTLSYFIGCINISAFVARKKFKTDLSKTGSGNLGATNMLRNFGFKWGFLIFIFDILKGTVAAIIGVVAFGDGYNANPIGDGVTNGEGQIGMYACGLAAVVGHCWPVHKKFKGGKGVSTFIGVFLVINPIVALLVVVLAFVLGFMADYASLSSIFIVSMCVLWEGFMNNPAVTVSALLIAFYVIILFKHRGNIYRLLNGTEKYAGLLKKRNKENK